MSLTEPFTAKPEPEGGLWQVLAGGSRTAGSVVFGEARLPPGASGPHLHVHSREDEAVYVIEGEMTFTIGERTFEAGRGTLVWLPRNVPHTFANLGRDPVWAFGTTTPAGLEGMFEEQAAYFASLSGPPDEDIIDEIGARYGVRRVGPPLARSNS
ncbi:MAG: cupin domain-containing protein [Actinomycetota bacterium]|nr:cupin domain-containing protein [Actinomycetota bacterium]